MAHPEETGAAGTDAPAAAETPAVDVQALIDDAVAAFAKQHGIDITPPPAPSALDALKSLEGSIEHVTFVQKLEHLAENGYQAAVDGEYSPVFKTLLTVVGEIASKVA